MLELDRQLVLVTSFPFIFGIILFLLCSLSKVLILQYALIRLAKAFGDLLYLWHTFECT